MPFPSQPIDRRSFLLVGATGTVGLGFPFLTTNGTAAEQGSQNGAAKSVILVNLTGGMSHIDTLDMKPDAPAEIRGEFKSISTSVAGLRICEHLPHLAQRMRH